MHTLAKRDLATLGGGICLANDDYDYDFHPFSGLDTDPFELIDTYVGPTWLQTTLKAGVVAMSIAMMAAFVMSIDADDDCWE